VGIACAGAVNQGDSKSSHSALVLVRGPLGYVQAKWGKAFDKFPGQTEWKPLRTRVRDLKVTATRAACASAAPREQSAADHHKTYQSTDDQRD
jgi:hypothetical protein